MLKVNDNFQKLPGSYLFSTIAKKVAAYSAEHPDKNIITRAIGVKENVEADFFEFSLKKGDTILMCTDGLCNMVDDEEIFAIIKGARDIVEAGRTLIDRANENGGKDNIGVVLAQPFSNEVSIW